MAWVHSLAQELLHAVGVATKEKRMMRNPNILAGTNMHACCQIINILRYWLTYPWTIPLPARSWWSTMTLHTSIVSKSKLFVKKKGSPLPDGRSGYPSWFGNCLHQLEFFFVLLLLEFPRLGVESGVATDLRHNPSNMGSKPWLQPTPQLTATPDP